VLRFSSVNTEPVGCLLKYVESEGGCNGGARLLGIKLLGAKFLLLPESSDDTARTDVSSCCEPSVALKRDAREQEPESGKE